jgi:endonuclease/exonuclease/phosphatase family metal-dependent hydrolase
MELKESCGMGLGDFNSYSESCMNDESDSRGDEVEDWQIENNLLLRNEHDDPPTFYSRRWHTTSTPDLAFVTDDLYARTTRTVLKQLGGSDHKPIKLSINLDSKPSP